MESIEAQVYRKQQSAFCILTLFVLGGLLLLHVLFAALLGEPSRSVISILVLAFLLKVWEALWIQGKKDGISARGAQVESVVSIVGLFILAPMLAFLTNRDDAPYFVLLAIPILQCAYHFGLPSTIAAVVSAVGAMFAWNWHYFHLHPPARPTEYLETGMISVIFCLTGPLVWFLVHELKDRETTLYENIVELEVTREKLLGEEKLAAIGRFASGIAHEIRNPVAMIASSLATAAFSTSSPAEREEMFAIAAREARRLENLTTDFLTYARPSPPQRSITSINDIVVHIADVTRMRAAERSIDVLLRQEGEIYADVDGAQIEGALLNLSLNALDATPDGGSVELRAAIADGVVSIDVENSGPAIPQKIMDRVFEPFFTSKPGGTGLGLPIARAVALALGGDIRVTTNRRGAVVFTMTFRRSCSEDNSLEASCGESTRS